MRKRGEWYMKIVIAMDSFKGSLTSTEAGEAVRDGIRRADPDACVSVFPLADGGEGTVDALIFGLKGERKQVTVTGPMGDPVSCSYGLVREKGLAVIEMAGAAGLPLVPESARNPLLATTYGVGEVILDAIREGCRRFLVGIGGSATNDGGAGMLQALGFSLLDEEGRPIPGGAAGLAKISSVGAGQAEPKLQECVFRIACDVKNPLCGPDGASAVYGPQKGADPDMVRKLDENLARFAKVTKAWNPQADDDCPGTGAAGGLGFGFLAYLNASLESGIGIVLDELGLDEAVSQGDLVITGEGRLDEQTCMGKAPAGVAALGRKYKKPVIAFAGCVTKGASRLNDAGIAAFFPILRGACSLEDAMKKENAAENLRDTAEQAMRLYLAGKGGW